MKRNLYRCARHAVTMKSNRLQNEDTANFENSVLQSSSVIGQRFGRYIVDDYLHEGENETFDLSR